MEKIVQDGLAELVKFESEEIDLDHIALGKLTSGLVELESYIKDLERENINYLRFIQSLGYSLAQAYEIAELGDTFNQDIAEN